MHWFFHKVIMASTGSERVRTTTMESTTKNGEGLAQDQWRLYIAAEANHPEAFNPGSMLPIIPNQSNLTS